MPKVLVVDNYLKPGGVNELCTSLEAGGAAVTVVRADESEADQFRQYDGVVLSGSPVLLSEPENARRYSKEIQAIREATVPILAICFGHQLVGIAFGSKVVKNSEGTRRYVDTDVVSSSRLFKGLPSSVSVFESHYEVVQGLPRGFSLLARSPSSPIGAMQHDGLPLYGTQFHPERNDAAHPDGRVIINNFVSGLV